MLAHRTVALGSSFDSNTVNLLRKSSLAPSPATGKTRDLALCRSQATGLTRNLNGIEVKRWPVPANAPRLGWPGTLPSRGRLPSFSNGSKKGARGMGK